MHFIPEKNVILLADTYNHKVKVVDPFRNEAFSWLGGADTPQNSLKDGTTNQCAFNEPQGISSLYDEAAQDVRVYICDTNNHCIRACHYDVGHLQTLVFKNVPAPNFEFHERNTVANQGSIKREPAKGANLDEASNLVCEGNQCYPKKD